MSKLLHITVFLISTLFTIVCVNISQPVPKPNDITFVEHKDTSYSKFYDKDSIFRNGKYASCFLENGVISDAKTAARVAASIADGLNPRYRRELQPFVVVRYGDVWSINGTVPKKYRSPNWEYDGGLCITLNRYNGEIVYIGR